MTQNVSAPAVDVEWDMKKYTLITKNFGHLFPTLNLKTKNFGQKNS